MKKLTQKKMLEVIAYYTRISEEYLDKLALFATIDLVAKGFTNQQVANILDIDVEGVLEDLSAISDFKGFHKEIQISPIFLYEQVLGDKEQFITLVNSNVPNPLQLYDFMLKYTKLRKELDKLYGIT